jgi:D-xylose transport system permease protein
MSEVKAPRPTAAPPAPTPIAADGSPAAVRSAAFGGITVSWDKLLTTVPIYVGLIVIWLYFDSQTAGKFIGARNLSEMAQEFSYEAVLAIGVVFVLLLGEIDLSLGYLTLLSVALTASFSALSHYSAGVSILLAIVVCTLCGLLQGMLIAWVRMPSFVVTLGGFLIFEGIAYHILAGSTINVFDPFISSIGTYSLSNTVSWIIAIVVVAGYVLAKVAKYRARASAGLPPTPVARTVASAIAIAVLLAIIVATLNSYRGVPVALAILAVFTIVFWFFASKLQIGRRIYAVGGNLEAARRAGINTTAVRWLAFGISGMMAGVAGVMLVGYSAAGSTTTAGPDLLLDVISIAVIGGVSLTGGKGTVWAVLLGGLVIASLDSGLNLMATDPYYVYVIKGAILLAAIGIDVIGKRSSGFSWLRRRTARA